MTVEMMAESALPVSAGLRIRPQVMNRITATILSVGSQGDRPVFMHTDDGAQLKMEGIGGSMALRPPLGPGQRVVMIVSSVDVTISVPRPRHLYGCNEWAGRVVLTNAVDGEPCATVKILGQPVTFTSTNVSEWMDRPVRVWDHVSLRIDPAAVRIVPVGTCARLRMRLLAPPHDSW